MNASRKLVMGIVLAWAIGATSSAGQTLPAGFTRDIVAGSLGSEPLGISIASDGRIFVALRGGTIKVIAQGSVGTLGTVPNMYIGANWGLQDVAVDPGWPTRPYLYAYWTYSMPRGKRISRFEVTGAVANPTSTSLALGAEYPILVDIYDTTTIHNGGSLRFLPDGTLTCSIGDDFTGGCLVQSVNNFLGKVIRLEVANLPTQGAGPPPMSALVPSNNPWTGPSDFARLVYARGMRNPWRTTVDALTGDLWVGEVGGAVYEEINLTATGGGQNFGWPILEGPGNNASCTNQFPPFTAPAILHDRSLEPPSAAVIVPVVLYRNQPGAPFNFGPAYEGNFFYTILQVGMWRRFQSAGGPWTLAPPVAGQPTMNDWANGFTGIFDAELGRDGAIYYLEGWPSNSVRRIRSVSPTLTLFSGDLQPVNAGTPALEALRVRYQDGQGSPLVGYPVEFAVTSGSGSFSANVVMTDAMGEAAATFIPGITPSPTLEIRASAVGASPVFFHPEWRGLEADWQPATRTLSLSVTHSQTNSPLTIAMDLPAASPIVTAMGIIETSILAPLPSLIVLDGLGLLGPPLPALSTGSPTPTWSLTVPNFPVLGGQTFTFQAYAIDTSLAPSLTSVLITNSVQLTIN